jgi:glycosyl transferase family 87
MAEARELTGTRRSRSLTISIEGLALALTRPITVAILCAAALLKAYLVFSILPARVKDWDFDLYYVTALALRENQNPYTVDYKPFAARLGIAVTPDWTSHDTPTLLLCFEPLTKLSMKEAFWIWTSLNVVALAVTLFILLRSFTTGLSHPMGLIITAMTILYDPVAMNFEYAQRQILILLLLVVAMRAMERDYDWLAGIMLVAAGLLRAFPLLLMVYLALAGRWRTWRCAVISLVAGGFITIVMVGAPCVDFVRALGWASQRMFLELSVNPALGPTVSRFFWFTSGFGLGAQHDALRRVAVVLAEAIILAVTVRATVRIEHGDRDWRAFSFG